MVDVPLQAWQSFETELKGLRQSFRFDEFNDVSILNPAKGPLGKVGGRWGGCGWHASGLLPWGCGVLVCVGLGRAGIGRSGAGWCDVGWEWVGIRTSWEWHGIGLLQLT